MCETCEMGYFGLECKQKCPDNCKDNTCNLDGTCGSCVDGYYKPDCSEPCEDGCLHGCYMESGDCNVVYTCRFGYYGEKCHKKCPPNCNDPNGCLENGMCGTCITCYHGNRCEEHCGSCECGRCDDDVNCPEECVQGYNDTDCNSTQQNITGKYFEKT